MPSRTLRHYFFGLNPLPPLGPGLPAGPHFTEIDLDQVPMSGRFVRTGEVPRFGPNGREAPPLLAFDYTEPMFHYITSGGAYVRALAAGKTSTKVAIFNGESYEESVKFALQYELPLRGRPITEVADVLEGYWFEVGQPSMVKKLPTMLGIGLSHLLPVIRVSQLVSEIRTMLRAGAISETAAACIGDVWDADLQHCLVQRYLNEKWSLPKLKAEVLAAKMAGSTPSSITRLLWDGIPEDDGPITSRFDYPEVPVSGGEVLDGGEVAHV